MSGTASPHLADLPRPADEPQTVEATIRRMLNRHPAIALSVAVVRPGCPVLFFSHGVGDVVRSVPVTPDTVFRIGSVTKTVTAVAVMQLWEEGTIELDAPANRYLRAFRLVPASPDDPPATIRHLLTHTSGIPDVIRLGDLMHPRWGRFGSRPAAKSVPAGAPVPPLESVYGSGLRATGTPGRNHIYTGHGFAALGQIVEDVTGMPLDAYLRARIFDPLGMTATHLLRSAVPAERLVRGCELTARGPREAPDREYVALAAGSIYSTTRDMAAYLEALVGEGANEHGSILRPETLATMFQPHHRPDPRLPGIGLGFFRDELDGRRIVGHDGRMPGFDAHLSLAPDDRAGVVALASGTRGAMFWLPGEMHGLLGAVIGADSAGVRDDVPEHPEVWGDLCGVYRPMAMDVRGRAMVGAGVRVFAKGEHLRLAMLSPIPALWRGVTLHPDDPYDPWAFRIRIDAPDVTARVVFRRGEGGQATTMHTDLGMLSFRRSRPG